MTPCPLLIDRIMAVMETAFDPAYGEAWNRRQITDALAMPSTSAIVVSADGKVIGADNDTDDRAAGFVLTRHAADEEELLLIGVLPKCRRNGLGQLLINRLFETARTRGVTRIFLEMRRGNPAIHLYKKLGFEPIGQRPNYYRLSDGSRIDAITFGRSI